MKKAFKKIARKAGIGNEHAGARGIDASERAGHSRRSRL
jgi:hypothetical protein